MPRITCIDCDGAFFFSPGEGGKITTQGIDGRPESCNASDSEEVCPSQIESAEDFMAERRAEGEERARRAPILGRKG